MPVVPVLPSFEGVWAGPKGGGVLGLGLGLRLKSIPHFAEVRSSPVGVAAVALTLNTDVIGEAEPSPIIIIITPQYRTR